LSRNNQERLGAPKSAAPAPPIAQTGESFSFATPTEFVDLPTGGKYYPEGHPLHGQDSVEIRYMTAKDEDILSSTTLLKKGIALDRLLQSVLVDRSIDINTLYIGDKNAILVAARVTGYGEAYNARTSCPSCRSVVNFEYDLSQLGVRKGEKWGDYAIRRHVDDRFIITLPHSKVDVEVRLLTSKDEDYLSQLRDNKKKKKLPESNLTDQLRMIVCSVNGHADPKSLQAFVEGLPARDSRYLRTAYELIVPNVNMSQEFSCESCGHAQEVTVPLSADFFWPDR
tara:strand:+ start:2217 stop:3065 length:849 start_codon:yes stop_codon:yes gene_type:complete